MKIFNHENRLPIENYPATTNANGRTYHIGEHNYPSVTTFLSKTKDMFELDRWKEREIAKGNDPEAIKEDAGNRGDELHSICEQYILNEPGYEDGKSVRCVRMFHQLRRYIDKIDKVLALENVLYSHEMGIAGRIDCGATFLEDDTNTIVDFKGSTKIKEKHFVEDYRLQVTIYSMMLYSMTKIRFPRYKIMIASETGIPTVISGNVKDHYADVMKRLELFRGTIKA